MFGCLRISVVSKERYRKHFWSIVHATECNVANTSLFKKEWQIASESLADVQNLKLEAGEDPASLKHNLSKCLIFLVKYPSSGHFHIDSRDMHLNLIFRFSSQKLKSVKCGISEPKLFSHLRKS